MSQQYSMRPVTVEEVTEFLSGVDTELELSAKSEDSNLSDNVKGEVAANYVDKVNNEAIGEAQPWEEHDKSLLDPETIQPWENGGRFTGRLQIQEGELTDDGVSFRYDLRAEDQNGDEWNISISGIVDDYDFNTQVDLYGNPRLRAAYDEIST